MWGDNQWVNNVPYGPTGSGKTYLSIGKHRCKRGTPSQRCWSISRPDEFAVFEWADDVNCCDGDGHLWGFHIQGDDLDVLGTECERIAKFPKPTNETDAWHGYPVHAKDRPERRPSPRFIQELYQRDVLTKVQKKRIQDSRI